jgi:hypothetical protein
MPVEPKPLSAAKAETEGAAGLRGECTAQRALERLKGAGDRKILDGSVMLGVGFLDSVIDALSAPCPCAEARKALNYKPTAEEITAKIDQCGGTIDEYAAECTILLEKVKIALCLCDGLREQDK